MTTKRRSALRATKLATGLTAGLASALILTATHSGALACANPSKAIGVSRTVQIDTTGGPGFGFQHYKVHDFLAPQEVVLTFDDGPLPTHTRTVLTALAEHCTKATFFPVGKLALGYPEVLREIVAQGHTVGGHTWSHRNLRKGGNKAIVEIEKGLSAVVRGAGVPTAPFFRYPYLRDSRDTLEHLSKRNIAVFSTDIDSFDFKHRRSRYRTIRGKKADMLDLIFEKLEKNQRKGIVLFHDINPISAKLIGEFLTKLKDKGYRIVHLTAKDSVKTLPQYDKMIEKVVKGLPAAEHARPTSSVVKTVPTVQ